MRKMYSIFISIIILFIIGGCFSMKKDIPQKKNASLSEEEIDLIGQTLAEWGNAHHEVILINGEPVNSVYPSAGGWETVLWNPLLGESNIPQYQINFIKLLKESNCSNQVLEYCQKLASKRDYQNVTSGEISSKLGCLGKTGFKEVEFSPD